MVWDKYFAITSAFEIQRGKMLFCLHGHWEAKGTAPPPSSLQNQHWVGLPLKREHGGEGAHPHLSFFWVLERTFFSGFCTCWPHHSGSMEFRHSQSDVLCVVYLWKGSFCQITLCHFKQGLRLSHPQSIDPAYFAHLLASPFLHPFPLQELSHLKTLPRCTVSPLHLQSHLSAKGRIAILS